MSYNIVLIMTDDAPMDTLDYMPYLTALDELVVFPNAFLPQPLCTPSRVTTWTGLDPLYHGVSENNTIDTVNDYVAFAQKAFPRALQKVGYTTCHIGKVLNNWPYGATLVPGVKHIVDTGFDESYSFDDSFFTGNFPDYYDYVLYEQSTATTYGAGPDVNYSTDVLTGHAEDFVERAAEPWFCQVSNFGPHPTVDASSTYPATRHAALYSLADAIAARRGNFNSDATYWDDKPAWLTDFYPSQRSGATETTMDTYRLDAWRSLASIDEQIEAIKDAIDVRDATMWDRTVLIFLNDNGNLFGEHRCWVAGRVGTKGVPYEEALHASLAIKWPGAVAGTNNAFVTNMDIAPTILEQTKARLLRAPQGQSLERLLLGDTAVTREALFMSADNGGALNITPWQAIRTADTKWVEYESTGESERYDLSTDPYEIENISGASSTISLRTTLDTLRDQLLTGE